MTNAIQLHLLIFPWLLRGLCQAAPPEDQNLVREMLEAILETRRHSAALATLEPFAAYMFGERWLGPRSDWTGLSQIAAYLSGFHQQIVARSLPREGILALSGGVSDALLGEALGELTRTMEIFKSCLEKLVALLDFDPIRAFGQERVLDLSFLEQRSLLARWRESIGGYHGLVSFNLLTESCRENGLSEFVGIAEGWQESPSALQTTFRRAWFLGLYERALKERSVLASFDASRHEQVVERFRSLDALLLERTRARLAQVHWDGEGSVNSRFVCLSGGIR